MAINSIALADMEVPDSYLESLPKQRNRVVGGDFCASERKESVYKLMEVHSVGGSLFV